MLHIDDLSYVYKREEPPYRYSMQVDAGEIAAVMGSSGSGKSTLLDLIAGFLQPQEGCICLDGKHLEHLPIEKRGVSILFQNHNLFEHLSVAKNIRLGRKEATDKEIADILEEVGLGGYEKRLASELSGGQQQRVALSRVLLRREPILLLDEPFAGLDEQTKSQILDLVREITDRHSLHTVMVTHDPEDAKHIADRRYLMHDHRLTPQ